MKLKENYLCIETHLCFVIDFFRFNGSYKLQVTFGHINEVFFKIYDLYVRLPKLMTKETQFIFITIYYILHWKQNSHNKLTIDNRY